MEKPEIEDEKEIYFEDLPGPAQEAIIDLIVSIIKNKSQRDNKGF
jgi:hypothetical protein